MPGLYSANQGCVGLYCISPTNTQTVVWLYITLILAQVWSFLRIKPFSDAGVKFQLRTERFKFMHEPMEHRGRQHTKNQRSAQCTETGFDGLSTNFVLTSQNLNEMSEQPVIALDEVF